jgi:lipopolysaccharide transport system ATP-binding protein
MGMRKHEITRRLDEIVDFAGVERYLDTPVKRYSSGMYVRLGFAVAAHLDNEILIVDEVLAVGDAEFQKKCLGKMGDVAKGEGRTVLFVSHNMGAIRNLCHKGMVLSEGKFRHFGDLDKSIKSYQSIFNDYTHNFSGVISQAIHFKSIELLDSKGVSTDWIYSGDNFKLNLRLLALQNNCKFSIAIHIVNSDDQVIVYSYNQNLLFTLSLDKEYNCEIFLNKVSIVPGIYNINIWIGLPGTETYLFPKNVFKFEVLQGSEIKISDSWNKQLGLYYLEPKIKIIE